MMGTAPSVRAAASALALGALLAASAASAQATVDPDLEHFIAGIRAIDHHAHPFRCVGPAEPPDDESDQIPADGFGPWTLPPGLDPARIDLPAAWSALYGLPANASEADALAAKQRAQREHGDGYGAWVLDRIGTETMFANRIALGRCLARPRFRWVSFVDALIFPLNNAGLRRENADVAVSVGGAEKLLRRYLAEAHASGLPPDLGGYLASVVTSTLERQREAGAVAVKFEAAYIRPLAFADVPQGDAAAIYAKYAGGAEPPAKDYRRLQDFLFHYIAREAGRLGMAVHIHVLGAGAGGFYSGRWSNPWLLEPLFNEPALRATPIVFVHGGWPATSEVGALLLKPNAYADISALTFVLPPNELAQVLRTWLPLAPEKVMFGTDTFGLTPTAGWEELAWLETRTARRALAIALTGMLRDGEIDRARAEELARLVLRENALRLYRLPGAPSAH